MRLLARERLESRPPGSFSRGLDLFLRPSRGFRDQKVENLHDLPWFPDPVQAVQDVAGSFLSLPLEARSPLHHTDGEDSSRIQEPAHDTLLHLQPGDSVVRKDPFLPPPDPPSRDDSLVGDGVPDGTSEQLRPCQY